ncbi:MAG: hypothetical protein MZV64_28010 [Ignavibacteriales bacterium]|nr:hypothetical protein [Ignavibacteriales bacterium]
MAGALSGCGLGGATIQEALIRNFALAILVPAVVTSVVGVGMIRQHACSGTDPGQRRPRGGQGDLPDHRRPPPGRHPHPRDTDGDLRRADAARHGRASPRRWTASGAPSVPWTC